MRVIFEGDLVFKDLEEEVINILVVGVFNFFFRFGS